MGRRGCRALLCCGGCRCVPALASAARWGEVQSLTPDWHGAGSAFMGEIQGRRLAGLLKAGRFAGASCVSGLLPLLPSLDARPSCLTRGMSAKSPRLCRLSPSGQGRSRSPGDPLHSTSLAGLWAVVPLFCLPMSPIRWPVQRGNRIRRSGYGVAFNALHDVALSRLSLDSANASGNFGQAISRRLLQGSPDTATAHFCAP